MAKRANSDTVDIGLRVKEPLRAQIERAAKQHGLSMNAEINSRLERSFDRQAQSLERENHLRHQWGPDVFAIAESMARSLWHIERYTGTSWVEDDQAFDLFKRTTIELIRNYRDLVLRNGRETPTGSFEDKSPHERAEMFAGLGGISPPYPRKYSPEQQAADRAASLESWRRQMQRRQST